jgi:hypothetical protein
MQIERLMTRAEAIALIRDSFGVPLTPSSFYVGANKLCPDHTSPCPRRAPEHVARYGPSLLYRKADILDWGRRLVGGQDNV